MNDNTLYYNRCYKLAKDKGSNSLSELVLYLKNNSEIHKGEYDLDRSEMIEIANRALWTYLNDVKIKQSFIK